MDPKEESEMPVEALLEKEKELRKELFNLRFQKTLGQITRPTRIRQVRRDIARVLTAVRAKRGRSS